MKSNESTTCDRILFLTRPNVYIYVCQERCQWRADGNEIYLAQQPLPPPQWARAFSFTTFLDHTQRRTTVGRTPLDEWSARRRNLYFFYQTKYRRLTLWRLKTPIVIVPHRQPLNVAFYVFIRQIQVLNILNMVYTVRFFSSKCSLFHNSNVFGYSFIHILYTGVLKLKNIISALNV